MKTVEEWFSLLPEPYNKQAIANSLKGNLIAKVDSIDMALSCGFPFSRSNEGRGYWIHFFKEVLPKIKNQLYK